MLQVYDSAGWSPIAQTRRGCLTRRCDLHIHSDLFEETTELFVVANTPVQRLLPNKFPILRWSFWPPDLVSGVRPLVKTQEVPGPQPPALPGHKVIGNLGPSPRTFLLDPFPQRYAEWLPSESDTLDLALEAFSLAGDNNSPSLTPGYEMKCLGFEQQLVRASEVISLITYDTEPHPSLQWDSRVRDPRAFDLAMPSQPSSRTCCGGTEKKQVDA
ncbi:uncharacterized protein MYCFIDRAFT_179378 [Pseudocercospora fijiensis CIRAD86]|uniref:Uncharacterized protein n=1 Tax=Pseudocercospora fijiensis (strain CIRAD86) TaxID=383855 RepID=M3A0I3_PSEFD|nr:uncharacterized protein MYCFIDRAFT_179378 [Pseudocercospora fijiensis CIRAD86]EME77916.1 hypothetical protein MYCFIDRAFT_179378 [Pseudocercospora fijiensis CIRAD86]